MPRRDRFVFGRTEKSISHDWRVCVRGKLEQVPATALTCNRKFQFNVQLLAAVCVCVVRVRSCAFFACSSPIFILSGDEEDIIGCMRARQVQICETVSSVRGTNSCFLLITIFVTLHFSLRLNFCLCDFMRVSRVYSHRCRYYWINHI